MAQSDHPAAPCPSAEQAPRRCLRCYYILENLQSNRCPECGRAFDFGDPGTYTRKPPYVRWKFWLPGLLLAAGAGLLIYLILLRFFGYGVAASIVLPLCVGVLAGYSMRFGGPWASMALGILAMAAVGLGLYTGGSTGVLCTLVLLAVALVPVMVGALLGWWLRTALKRSSFSQRAHLPFLILPLIPLIAASIEGRHDDLAIMTLRTSMVIEAAPAEAWQSIQFYEQVRHRPPLLLRLLLPRPLYTRGKSEKAGDVKICIYSKGQLAKRITAIEPGRRLVFDVIRQEKIENKSIRLIDGSFELEAIDGGRRTRVTLTTRYQPLLYPRPAWKPAETWAVHTLHGHVLEGMRLDAMEKQRAPK